MPDCKNQPKLSTYYYFFYFSFVIQQLPILIKYVYQHLKCVFMIKAHEKGNMNCCTHSIAEAGEGEGGPAWHSLRLVSCWQSTKE